MRFGSSMNVCPRLQKFWDQRGLLCRFGSSTTVCKHMLSHTSLSVWPWLVLFFIGYQTRLCIPQPRVLGRPQNWTSQHVLQSSVKVGRSGLHIIGLKNRRQQHVLPSFAFTDRPCCILDGRLPSTVGRNLQSASIF